MHHQPEMATAAPVKQPCGVYCQVLEEGGLPIQPVRLPWRWGWATGLAVVAVCIAMAAVVVARGHRLLFSTANATEALALFGECAMVMDSSYLYYEPIHNYIDSVATAESCCHKCQKAQIHACRSWTWIESLKRCYTKSSLPTQRLSMQGYVSGYVSGMPVFSSEARATTDANTQAQFGDTLEQTSILPQSTAEKQTSSLPQSASENQTSSLPQSTADRSQDLLAGTTTTSSTLMSLQPSEVLPSILLPTLPPRASPVLATLPPLPTLPAPPALRPALMQASVIPAPQAPLLSGNSVSSGSTAEGVTTEGLGYSSTVERVKASFKNREPFANGLRLISGWLGMADDSEKSPHPCGDSHSKSAEVTTAVNKFQHGASASKGLGGGHSGGGTGVARKSAAVTPSAAFTICLSLWLFSALLHSA